MKHVLKFERQWYHFHALPCANQCLFCPILATTSAPLSPAPLLLPPLLHFSAPLFLLHPPCLCPQRTADGTLVALPNKLVSDLIVYNRTRALESAPKAVAGAGSSSAPLRRVLCFTLQLGREHEADLDAIRADVGALLNAITKEQLVASGLAPDPSTASVDAAKASNGNGNGNGAGGNGSGSGNGNGKALKSTGKGALDAVPAAAAAAAAAAVLERSSSPSSSQAGKATSEADAADAAEASPPPPPEPEPLAVSVTLKQLTETQISLFVR